MTCNPMDLTGRPVLVTGASSGLGRATAVLASRLGARLLLLGRNPERLQETLCMLEGKGHHSVVFDLSDTEKIPAFIAEQAARFAPFAGLVHSAGESRLKPLCVCNPQDFIAHFQVHVVAASQLIRGLTRRGATAPGGCSVVILGSIASIVGAPGMAAYCSSKAAVLGLVRAAALELAKTGFRVNAVLPGYCVTPMTLRGEQVRTAEQIRQVVDDHPLGPGRPEDVANAAAFLLADTARWITGTALLVDGGCAAH